MTPGALSGRFSSRRGRNLELLEEKEICELKLLKSGMTFS
jgi:hypothetical protein